MRLSSVWLRKGSTGPGDRSAVLYISEVLINLRAKIDDVNLKAEPSPVDGFPPP